MTVTTYPTTALGGIDPFQLPQPAIAANLLDMVFLMAAVTTDGRPAQPFNVSLSRICAAVAVQQATLGIQLSADGNLMLRIDPQTGLLTISDAGAVVLTINRTTKDLIAAGQFVSGGGTP